jgi:DMSO/TMAO reductase YedYZ molybdopterin-dependent catalytic subunit
VVRGTLEKSHSIDQGTFMSKIISRGFHGRRRDPEQAERVPPGQYLVEDFPVLSAGPTPHTPLDRWDFSTEGDVEQPKRWTWDQFRACPSSKSSR